jgi:LPS O-antigen subunit length determinant protein (WzzB/FepE family)
VTSIGIETDKNLLIFWRFLWSKRRRLLVYAICFGVLGVIVSAITPPRYTAEAVILPPTESELAGFILAQIAISRADSPEIYDLLEYSEIFRAFKVDLASRAHQAEFFQSDSNPLSQIDQPRYLTESKDGYSKRTKGGDYAAFSTKWLIEPPRSESLRMLGVDNSSVLSIDIEGDRTSHRPDIVLRVTWRDPKQATLIANNLLSYIDSVTTKRVRGLLITGIEIRKTNLLDMITYQRKLAEDLQQNSIKSLQESISIARQLEIKSPSKSFGDFNIVNIVPPPSYYTDPGASITKYEPGRTPRYLPLYYPGAIARSNSSNNVNYDGPPLYSRGWQALEEELRILKNREDLDPFIPQLTKLKNELDWLNSINTKAVVFSTANVVAPAMTPSQPSSAPIWIVIFGFSAFGFLLGALISMIGYATKSEAARS